ITVWYGGEEAEMATLYSKLTGKFAVPFWLMVAFCSFIPFGLMAFRATRTVAGTTVASVAVVIGMWLERFNIVVPTSLHPRVDMPALHYVPSWVELSIMAATFSGFILVYMVATKFFPIVSIWEIQEGREKSIDEVTERVAEYLPHKLEAVES
ncbi:MAG TPA: hypothetical protein VFL80_10585, partial [Thermoanaerobaculia bacterium]|nr:hypothetical protein [Thermoanaerobaculia bacterium]